HCVSRSNVRVCGQLYRVRHGVGVVTGMLVKAAHRSGTPDAWRAPIDAVWTHPIMGGSLSVPAPFLAVLGSIALSIGVVAAASQNSASLEGSRKAGG
ncbi:MAG: hypothetical protein WBX20_14430, partial [Terrimicrobiaceae bacterium]